MWIQLAIKKVLTIIVEELALPCFRLSDGFPATSIHVTTSNVFLVNVSAMV